MRTSNGCTFIPLRSKRGALNGSYIPDSFTIIKKYAKDAAVRENKTNLSEAERLKRKIDGAISQTLIVQFHPPTLLSPISFCFLHFPSPPVLSVYLSAQLTLKRDSIEFSRVTQVPSQSSSRTSPGRPQWKRLVQSGTWGDEQVALWHDSAYTSARAARDRTLAEQLHTRQCGGREGVGDTVL